MARMKKARLEREYVQVPNETAKSVEEKNNPKPVSLEALGLLVNLWSYDVGSWELHKTELYKRYAKNKKTSVTSAWNELVESNYIIEFKFRNGRKWEYVYIYNIRPFSEEEKQKEIDECVDEYGVSSTSDFQQLKFNSSKRTVQNPQISNTTPTKEKSTKEKLKKEDIKPIFDDEEKEPFEINEYAFREFVHQFNKNFPNHFDNKKYNDIYLQMHVQKLKRFTYNEAKAQARYMQQRIDAGKLDLGDYAAYFVGGILRKRTSEKSVLKQEKLEKIEKEYKEKKEQEEKERQKHYQRSLPFYNWLEN